MKLLTTTGLTSKRVRIRVQDSSQSGGQGLTGLVFNTSGLTAYYFRDGDTSTTAITLVTATLGTWTSGGFVAVDATNMPGVYEFGVPNAVFANAGSSHIILRGAANMVDVPLEFEVDAVNYQSANGFITGVNGAAVSSPSTAQTIDLTEAVPLTNTANTIGDCLNAARAQGFGKWVITGTNLSLYANDGVTVVRSFTLNSATAPTSRT